MLLGRLQCPGGTAGGRRPRGPARPAARPAGPPPLLLLLAANAGAAAGSPAVPEAPVPLALRLKTSHEEGAATVAGASFSFRVGGVWLAEEELCSGASEGALVEAARILSIWPSQLRLRAPPRTPPFLDAWGLEQITIVHVPSGRSFNVLEPCVREACEFRTGSAYWVYSDSVYTTYEVPPLASGAEGAFRPSSSTITATTTTPPSLSSSSAAAATSEAAADPAAWTCERLLGSLGAGVACQENATGTGFIMYSAERVGARFGLPPGGAEHLACVQLRGGAWLYSGTASWRPFDLAITDVLIASVSFDSHSVESLAGKQEEELHGAVLGYIHGNLFFEANTWNGTDRNGSVEVTGTSFFAHCPQGRADRVSSWTTGSWSACNASCGWGVKSRLVACTAGEESLCGSTGLKPAESMDCWELGSCESEEHVAEGACLVMWGSLCLQWWVLLGFSALVGACLLFLLLRQVRRREDGEGKEGGWGGKAASHAVEPDGRQEWGLASAASTAPAPLLLGAECSCEGGAAPEASLKLTCQRPDAGALLEDCVLPPPMASSDLVALGRDAEKPAAACSSSSSSRPGRAGEAPCQSASSSSSSSSGSAWRGQGASSGSARRSQTPAKLPPPLELGLEDEDRMERLLGKWGYGSEGGCYLLSRDPGRREALRCDETLPGGARLRGLLRPVEYWYEGDVFCAEGGGELWGATRLFFAEELGCVQSNFKEAGSSEWGPDLLASLEEVPSTSADGLDGADPAAHPAPRGVPQVLCIASPPAPSCTGIYALEPGKRPGGLPLWKKQDASRWLYSGADGRWYVGGRSSRASDFNCATGRLVCREPHQGALPHELGPHAWAWGCGGVWHGDPGIEVSAWSPVEDTEVEAPKGSQADDSPGAYRVIHDHTAVTADLLVSPPNITAHLASGAVVRVVEVVVLPLEQRVRGCIEDPHGWISLYNLEDGYRWAQRIGDDAASTRTPASTLSGRTLFNDEPDSCASESPAASAPRLLIVTAPRGQRECAGLYVLAAGRQMDGQPVWEQGGGGEHHLYSRNGHWCVGGEGSRACESWLFQGRPHMGAMPHEAQACWKRWDGAHFKEDVDVVVDLAEQPGPPVGGAECGSDEELSVPVFKADGQIVHNRFYSKPSFSTPLTGAWV